MTSSNNLILKKMYSELHVVMHDLQSQQLTPEYLILHGGKNFAAENALCIWDLDKILAGEMS